MISTQFSLVISLIGNDSLSEWRTLLILIRWLCQKLAEMDLLCFQKGINQVEKDKKNRTTTQRHIVYNNTVGWSICNDMSISRRAGDHW